MPLVLRGPGVPVGSSVSAPTELLDIYPTLLDLAGLPANPTNEGESLVPLLENPDREWPHAAITTYGQNNHGIAVEGYRYIRYEDGSEEYYDHTTDPNEWHNLASDTTNRAAMDDLARHLPEINATWSALANIDVYDYFKDQKTRSLRESD